MSNPQADFVVASSIRLPGLGLLLLPEPPSPIWLTNYELHTALAFMLLVEAHPPISITGTIEELARDGQLAQRALLLNFAPEGLLGTGSRLQISSSLSDF